MIHHLGGIIGLTLNTGGALLLLKFPTAVASSEIGWSTEQMAGLRLMLPAAQRSYRMRLFCYNTGIGLLAAGFLLQLIDLLHS